MLACRGLVLWPGERPVCDNVLRKDDVVPCGHIFLLWQSGVDCLEAGSECMVLLVECRLLDLAAEGGPVSYVGFQLRQLSRSERVCNFWWMIKLCHTERDVEEDR